MTAIDPFETRTGQIVTLRLVPKDDVHLLLAPYYRLSPETRRLRFRIADNIQLMKLVKGLELKNVESNLRYGQVQIRLPIV